MRKKIFEIINGTRGDTKTISRVETLINMCMNCSDYELCLRDNSVCYQYLEEEKRLNEGKKKGLNQRTNKNDLR